MSKWIGEGEKTVKTLFAVAAYRQPSVIFIDEIDSLLCQRSSEENEATRRMKTEFMVQLDGASTDLSARVVIIGATNRPEELDEAVRRRFVKRIYIPLPDDESRRDLLNTLLKGVEHSLTHQDVEQIVGSTDGYSGRAALFYTIYEFRILLLYIFVYGFGLQVRICRR
ncbi:ATP-binding protein [archaeon]|nr:MAG: ATP-binding protein [archaeon]